MEELAEAEGRLPPFTPAQQGGASGSSQHPVPPSAVPHTELDEAELTAALDREGIEDEVFASILQAAFYDLADAEEASRRAAAQVPSQPATSEPAGGSLWDDV